MEARVFCLGAGHGSIFCLLLPPSKGKASSLEMFENNFSECLDFWGDPYGFWTLCFYKTSFHLCLCSSAGVSECALLFLWSRSGFEYASTIRNDFWGEMTTEQSSLVLCWIHAKSSHPFLITALQAGGMLISTPRGGSKAQRGDVTSPRS